MLWSAFAFGFLGSFHCVGMCGPIAMAVSANRSRLIQKLLYNLGRTTTYAFLGTVIGTLGFSLALAGIQQWLSIFLGGLMILMALYYKRSERIIAGTGWFGGVAKLKTNLGSYIRKGGSKAFFFSGMLNGLLPCGMVYLALVASMGTQNPMTGALYMALFGLGTVPALLLMMLSPKLLTQTARLKLNRGLPYLAMFIGVLFILRGLSLGIHPISPSLGVNAASQFVEMTLCK
ncbi:sulfite exporter TauE/SafE family protein [Pleomorphovibrio marinus]|uniref:sulfite exporter TauE/SafE family protein n=1 Tax=Pleomorphovibrio marinus TaxID=2164132 RepID=UPI000E0BD456|nr:sulfite exporter TauE/SafE family protein [Pleomorphovibrio marinus]